MPKLRSTYDGRLIYKTSYEGRKAFLSIGVNSYWAQGLKPPTFMIMGLAYMTSPPTFVT